VHWAASILGEGFYSSNWMVNSASGIIARGLQQAYGDGGSGFVSLHSIIGTQGIAGMASTLTATGTTGTGVGGWDLNLNSMNSYAIFPHAGQTPTYTDIAVRGRFIDIFWIPLGVSTNQFAYQVDGGPFTVVNTGVAITGTFGVTTVDLGTPNVNHTLTVSAGANGAAGSPFMMGHAGRNAAGMLPIIMGFSGRTSADVNRVITANGFTGVNGSSGGLSIQTGPEGPPDLLIYSDVWINDIAAALTSVQVAANTAQTFDFARGGNPNCDIVVAMAHRGSTADANELYPQYMETVEGITKSYGGMFINMWTAGQNNYNYMAGYNYWGDGAADGLPGNNSVHPSDIGHNVLGNFILQQLLA
jgi:hypothetical protein